MLCVEQHVSILSEIMYCKEKEKYLYLTYITHIIFFILLLNTLVISSVFCYLEILIHILLSKADSLIEDREGHFVKT